MNRRDFLFLSASALASASLGSCAFRHPKAQVDEPQDCRDALTSRFQTILAGFLQNARATSPDYTACDFPQGTRLRGCCTPSGKTYVSVARMLPAMAEFVVARDAGRVEGRDLLAVLRSIFRTAFDPKHPDYWGEPTGAKPTQRTVESALVAIALARLGTDFARSLTSAERANINRWLASCTVIPERTNNHAWFTAVNQAARLKLARSFPEFQGDETWMLEDLKAMDVLAANAADGWYSDHPSLKVYDYYNFWTFGNFPLFWSRIAGDLYPDWNEKLKRRGKEFLTTTPYFFAEDGSLPLFGRSLLYRWSVLSPLLLGYEQGVWPHSPGLLRRIIRKNFTWWWDLGAYDATLGKLRETLSPAGTADVSEGYVDNGHPYWAMLAFTFFSIPAADPLWTAPEEPLPVEKGDYLLKLSGPKMLLAGTKASGQVRWLQALNTPRREYYRDKYNKFVSSSAFPFNVISDDKKPGTWDQALAFHDPETGTWATRLVPDSGELLDDGVTTVWTAHLDKIRIRVVSTIRLSGEFEHRGHEIAFEVSGSDRPAQRRIDVFEGSYPLGLGKPDRFSLRQGAGWAAIRSTADGRLIACWRGAGHERIHPLEHFPQAAGRTVNAIFPRMAMLSLSCHVSVPRQIKVRTTSLHYASTKPLPWAKVHARAGELLDYWA